MKQMLPLACALLLAGCTDREATAVLPEAAAQVRDAGAGLSDVAAPVAEAAAGTASAFCAAGEEVVFGCSVGPQHTVALCGSGDLSKSGGRLQYREGASGADARLAWPPDGTAPSQAFRSGTLMYSGGGGAFLRFDRDGRTYTVFTGIGRGWEKAGVLVRAKGETVEHLPCDGSEVSRIGPELFARAGIPEDGQGFEIP